MNIVANAPLLDQLAASYALGTLRGGARRRFEALARDSVTVRTTALLWHERMSAMTELQIAQQPSPNVWKRIANVIEADALAAPSVAQPAGLEQALRQLKTRLSWWRGAALAGGLASLAAVTVGWKLQADYAQQSAVQLDAVTRVGYVAVLADDQATASMLVTFDPRKNTLTLKRVGGYQAAFDKSLQLWALPGKPLAGEAARGPQSLGVLTDGDLIQLPASASTVSATPALAISLEPKGGVPSAGGPTGPVLFKGALLSTTL